MNSIIECLTSNNPLDYGTAIKFSYNDPRNITDAILKTNGSMFIQFQLLSMCHNQIATDERTGKVLDVWSTEILLYGFNMEPDQINFIEINEESNPKSQYVAFIGDDITNMEQVRQTEGKYRLYLKPG